jgi:hypothetical protein
MIVPAILLILSSALAGFSFFMSGPVLSDLMLIALILGSASLILLLFAVWRARKRTACAQGRWIVIDGSNVMHWKDQTPQIATVVAVVQELVSRGYSPGVVFDANAGYKLSGRFAGELEFSRLLGLHRHNIFVVPKGTQADPFLLNAARELQAKIVTNDRFRDWAEAHPEVQEPGHLIRGGFRDGKLWLDDKLVQRA